MLFAVWWETWITLKSEEAGNTSIQMTKQTSTTLWCSVATVLTLFFLRMAIFWGWIRQKKLYVIKLCYNSLIRPISSIKIRKEKRREISYKVSSLAKSLWQTMERLLTTELKKLFFKKLILLSSMMDRLHSEATMKRSITLRLLTKGNLCLKFKTDQEIKNFWPTLSLSSVSWQVFLKISMSLEEKRSQKTL